jgi:outer membrane protein assembly factor BamD
MITRVATLAILALVLSSGTGPAAEQATLSEADQLAAREMVIGRWLIEQRNYTSALNRFKVVVTRYQASPHVEEAWARLVETYLTLGIGCEAQNVASELGQKFPDGRWTEALNGAGLDPVESRRRCY